MASPTLSSPTLFSFNDLKTNTALVDNITALINDAFVRSYATEPDKWTSTDKRFPTRESYLNTIGPEGVVSVIFDDSETVAVCGAIPWQGGYKKEGAGSEQGWEVKAVAVHGDAKYLRRGLATQLYKSLEDCLVELERRKELERGGEVERPGTRQVVLWVIAADCINGVYWRKTGYREVRREASVVGDWGCRKSFDMVVLRKDVPFDIAWSYRKS